MESFRRRYYNLVKLLKERAIAYYGDRLVSLVVFGSVASERFTPESDIDLLVVLQKVGSNYETYIEFIEQVEEYVTFPLPIRVSPIIKSVDTLSVECRWLWGGIFRVLHDPKGFFVKFLRKLRRFEQKHLRFRESPIPHYEVIGDE